MAMNTRESENYLSFAQFYAHSVHQIVSRFFGPRNIGDDLLLGPRYIGDESSLIQSYLTVESLTVLQDNLIRIDSPLLIHRSVKNRTGTILMLYTSITLHHLEAKLMLYIHWENPSPLFTRLFTIYI